MMKTPRMFFVAILLLAVCASCTKNDDFFPFMDEPPFGNMTPGSEDGEMPDFDRTIQEYDGELADDAASDVVGSNEDLYWEANSWKTKVLVKYNGNTATVESDNAKVEWHTEGAHVVLDLQSNTVSGVEVEVSGKSDDGSLKIYGEKKFMLTLNGVELTSGRGAAINSQCKKRCFVHLAEGTTNRITDNGSYSDDAWYIGGATADDEDRKGCFFSEGNLIFSGTGVLIVAGKQKHGIASDGYMYTRPGVTIVVTEAAKNAIHIKGDKDDDIGILVTGGLIYTNVTSAAGKGLKTDRHVEVTGGKLDLNTSGEAIYDEDEKDTSSAAGIKTDGDIRISGGSIKIKSTGTGGKGMNADGNMSMTGGSVTISTTGGKYVYNAALDLDSSPKGIKVDGDIVIDGGELNISVTGVSDGSEGMESKAELTINGGEIFIYAYDDAINASTGITINGGRVYAYAVNNDGIDSNGYMHLNGGLTIASGASGSEESFDCEISSKFLVNGGTFIGTGGTYMTTPSSSSKQRVVLYGGISASKGDKIAVLDSSGKPIATYAMPRTMNSMVLFLSSPDIVSGGSYTISKGGSISGYTDSWNGWYGGGTWSGGSQVGAFTSNSVVTTAGSSGGPGGGGNPPGSNPPGGGRW